MSWPGEKQTPDENPTVHRFSLGSQYSEYGDGIVFHMSRAQDRVSFSRTSTSVLSFTRGFQRLVCIEDVGSGAFKIDTRQADTLHTNKHPLPWPSSVDMGRLPVVCLDTAKGHLVHLIVCALCEAVSWAMARMWTLFSKTFLTCSCQPLD